MKPRRFWRWARNGFLHALDTETVVLFVWPYYITLFAWGFFSFILGQHPANQVQDVMGEFFYQIWLIGHMVGTTEVMVGLVLPNKYVGLFLQLGGNASMALMLFAYELSAFKEWGISAYSFFAIAPYVVGCCFLTATCIRKLYLTLRFPAGRDSASVQRMKQVIAALDERRMLEEE
jgi:hypothetical protein